MANLGLHVKYLCIKCILYSCIECIMYIVRMLVLYVEAIEWQSWKQTSPGFSSLIIIDWSYLNNRLVNAEVKKILPYLLSTMINKDKVGRENEITS